MITLPLVLNDTLGRYQRCRRCGDKLTCYAARLSRSSKIAIKKGEKIRTLHLMLYVS
jgi:hypothetical protein